MEPEAGTSPERSRPVRLLARLRAGGGGGGGRLVVPAEDRDRDPAAVLRGGGGDRAVGAGRMVRPPRHVAALGGAADLAALLRHDRPARRARHPAARPADRAAGQPAAAPSSCGSTASSPPCSRAIPSCTLISAAARAPPRWRRRRAELFQGLGGISLSLLGAVALAIVFFSTVAFIVLDPRPPAQRLSRQPAARYRSRPACAPIAGPPIR